MRIVLNAQKLSREPSHRSGGISRHIYHLLAELARDPRGHRYDVFVPEAPPPGDPLAAPALHFHATGAMTVRPSMRILWEQTVLPARLAMLKPDLLHGLAYANPFGWGGAAVVTIYDLSFLRYPEAFNRGNREYLARASRVSARRARQVITISEHAREEIIRLLGIPPDRVHVTYLAADTRFRPLPAVEIQRFRADQGLPESFVFSLGTLEPRKNLAGLLEAYARLPQPRVPLYVAGAAGWRYAPIFEQVHRLGLDRDVHFLGFVAEDQLPLWYNSARLFAFPSLYEGFGLPVLEAMACGTPVITSNAASLPEVGGKAVRLVPPGDPTEMAAVMEQLLTDDGQRAAMRAAGLIQASRFSWRAMADRTVQVYELATARS